MAKVVIHAIENGPNVVLVDGKFLMELCRCGHSEHKPECDGSHKKVGFRASKAETKIIE